MFRQLTSTNYGHDIYSIKKDPSWVTYRDAYNALLDYGATLLSEGERLGIAKKADEMIPENAELMIICDQETYENISNQLVS
ncbi:hypothetical protein [Piscibacillus halophilus]|uniref:Voltage-gated potassium channel n=1 Tax=Piscibacillus halophilus TaxID=571933 RepID=A0A1H9IN72_9BACI|nr:hypothetical protein [Piscibacillus halophilus]SEQ75825.1 voltage-gated potassium channel [Piscibacillus halophilus]